MKILITGAAGFLGSHLSDKLLNDGHEIFGVDNFFRGNKNNLPIHENFKFHELDLRDFNKTKDLFYQIQPEVVIHYAAINGTRYFYDIPFKVCDDNILLTQNVVKSCGDSVSKIIYASSSEIYGPEPRIPTKENEFIILDSLADRDSYASSKAIGEFLIRLWAKENNKKYLIVRPFNTYGPRMSTKGYGQVIPELIERIKSGEEFYLYGDGKQTRSFCYVDDHCEIMCRLLNNADNVILNVGYDQEVTINDLAKTIHRILNKNYSVIYKEAWKNDTKWRKPDLSELKKYTGEIIYTKLNDGLLKMIN